MEDGRTPRVKNRAPAAIQITAEQLLREAQERQDGSYKAPRQRVEDFEELNEYRGRKRREFEEKIRRTRGNLKEWQQYAHWEAGQGEYDRARSVFERALDVDPRATSLWLSYTEMELKARNVQHARNLFDRAVTLLPRIDQFWYKYVYLEELLQNVPGARQVFERWMKWEPDDKAWQAYIKMEERYGELDRSSAIYERWVAVRPEPRVWVKWAKFEEERQMLDKAREVFQTAVEFFGDNEEDIEKAQAVFGAFAKMEIRAKEYERARVIYKFALDRLPRSKSSTLYAAYTRFEKQHGSKTTVDITIIGKRRIQYEDEISQNAYNYDTWFDFARLEESALQTLREEGESGEEEAIARVREVYERAVAHQPPGLEKRHWRRYIFLWLDYALFEELETKDYDRAREIYKTAIQVVPNKQFTFGKLWVQYAHFEVRRLNLPIARKILGASIGMCPKESLFKNYIQLEIDLREFDNARKIYEKLIEWDPTNPVSWINYAGLESLLADTTRARAIYGLGISQQLSSPEILWKSYIDFEVSEGERGLARALYERLVELSGHFKVWIAYGKFEGMDITIGGGDEDEEDEEAQEATVFTGDPQLARQVFRRGYDALRAKGEVDGSFEARELLNAWKEFEVSTGDETNIKVVESMLPYRVTSYGKNAEDGQHETYQTWVFPDDQKGKSTISTFLANAHKWRQNLAAAQPSAAEDTHAMDVEPTAGSSHSRDSEAGTDESDEE